MSSTSTLPFNTNTIFNNVHALLTNPTYFWALVALIVAFDVVLTQLIIYFIPYTEIDWETYMVQTELYLKGQRDYAQITGPTGPLVYPAGHVHIHHALYNLTDSGKSRALAQQIYASLYVVSLCLNCAIYWQAKGIPNWIVLALPLSKRLHSIFVLRLFNDCWSVVAMQGAVLAYQRGWDDIGTLLFSAALSVKMSIFLYLPGLLVILFKRHGLLSTLRHMATVALFQVVLALPFLLEHPWPYLQYSFDFSRVFLYKWTVNWRFVKEDVFLSSPWAQGLLIGHASTLVAFGLFRWCRTDGSTWGVLSRGIRRPTQPAGLPSITPDYVATILFTCNLIGILFARSLHYQFYCWYAQQIPFLTWRTRYPFVFKFALILGFEYTWNVFPSTSLSSALLLAAHVILLAGIWSGYPEGKSHVSRKTFQRS